MGTPERKSDFAKRVLFGTSKAAAAAAASEKQAAGSSRSGSHSSTSSAPCPGIYSVPGTPSKSGTGMSSMLRTPGKPSTSSNAALSVFLRVRPPGTPEADLDKLTGRRTYQILEDQTTLRTFPPLSAGHSRIINRQAKDFGFTRVFGPAAGQAETYESTMRPLVDDVFASQNALLFAYGMTNAGKTYTVLGEDASPGLIPQALTDTFERVAKMGEGEADVRVEMSFLEIYIENVYDLLAAADADDWAKARTALKLDDRMGVIQARDLSKHIITSAADGLELVRRATANRRVASTRLNEDSSRSHSVCMIKLVRAKGKDSSLWVVDLAGSERSGRTGAGATSTRQKEANNINKSLSTLWHCLTIMRANLRKEEPESRVPFRESKLTHLFKNHLQGPTAGKTVMVVNINPSTADFDETQQVLKNSTIAREVKTVKDDSAASRQNGLIHTPYGFNGRKMVVKKPQASRRSIHQAVAPKLEGLGLARPRQNTAQSPKRVLRSHGGAGGDTDCGSEGDAEGQEGGGEGADGDDDYMSGAESDSGLVDTRQSMNLVVKNLQAENAALKQQLQASLAMKTRNDSARGHEPIPGGPLEQYIEVVEAKVTSAEARMEQMRQDHQTELRDLENEFESFLSENGLDKVVESEEARQQSPTSGDAGVSTAVVKRLQEEVRVANLQADQWKKEAETLRARLAAAVGGGGSGRSPLRQSTGSAGARNSLENRQDGENSPPGHNGYGGGSGGPTPGGVGSPSTSTSPPKTKALPHKKTKQKSSTSSPSSLAPSTISTTVPPATGQQQQQQQGSERTTAGSRTVGERDSRGAPSRPGRESKESGGCWGGSGGGKGKVIVAVSRRVSVLRVSAAGSRRVSSVRASMASGRRASRASYAAALGGRRASQLPRSRVSVANAGNGNGGDEAASSVVAVAKGAEAAVAAAPDEDAAAQSSCSGLGSRRESAIILAVQNEENFFEKARRCVLRAIGVGRKSTLGRAGSTRSWGSGGSGGASIPAVAETAEEIELRHKIKVKMPKRPSKKAMEGVAGVAESQGFEEIEHVQVVEEEEEGGSSANRASTSAVMSGIERWVFGGKAERSTPVKTPPRSKVGAAAATAEVSPMPGTTTMHDYVRAM